MASPIVSALRSVALDVPDVAATEDFYTRVWHLRVAARGDDGSVYLRGTGPQHHLLSLHPAAHSALRHVTFQARNADALQAMARAAAPAGGRVVQEEHEVTEPGGGRAVTVVDPDGRVFRLVHGDARHDDTEPQRDFPVRLAHVVLNAHDIDATQQFFAQVLGFKLSDRTKVMAFLNCNNDHHSVALGDSDNDALNHIAFLMPDLESVMRGGGRMHDAGFPVQWGPGRHGPGDNAFNYFLGPDGVVIEYTAEVEQIDDSYRTGGPGDWTWPEGRIDQWGIATGPTPQLKQAQRNILFAPA